MLGDSPTVKTGFGRVQRKAAEAFLAEGWEVAVVAGHLKEQPESDLPIKFYLPQAGDEMGILAVPGAVEDFKPDRIYIMGEPGTLTAYASVTPTSVPVFAYCPIEGEPILNHYWREVLKVIDFMTCSRYGVKVVKESIGKDIGFAYHGVDPVFRPLPPTERARLRAELGWADKFVLITVATNVNRKQWPRLFEALRILKSKYNQRDILLYAHTVPFDNHYLEGWNLPEVAMGLGVNDEVVFNPLMSKHLAAIPEESGDVPSLPELYAAADLFVLPSQVEGFGLPIAESLACGTPALVTRYAAGWEVAAAGGTGIAVKDWTIHKSGTRYANVDPESIAREILRLKRNPKQLAALGRLGVERAAADFTWDDFKKKVVDGTRQAKAPTPIPEV